MKIFKTFTKFEWVLWIISMSVVTGSFLFGKCAGLLTLIASLTGVTALIFVAKGNVTGQVLTVIFSLLYAVISYSQSYYGEMITYLGMTAPIAVMSVVTWLRHPFDKDKSEVKVAVMTKKQTIFMLVLAALVTLVFYFILRYFNTAKLAVSVVSITTSFIASYLTMMRSPFYALAYSANDIVLVIMWTLSSLSDISYLPMAICFVMFWINDIYGFYNWKRIHKRQLDAEQKYSEKC